jgi:hypothetical protein
MLLVLACTFSWTLTAEAQTTRKPAAPAEKSKDDRWKESTRRPEEPAADEGAPKARISRNSDRVVADNAAPPRRIPPPPTDRPPPRDADDSNFTTSRAAL